MSMYVAPEGGLHLRLVVYMSTKSNLLFSFIFRAWSKVIQIGAIISASQITCSGVFFCFVFLKICIIISSELIRAERGLLLWTA